MMHGHVRVPHNRGNDRNVRQRRYGTGFSGTDRARKDDFLMRLQGSLLLTSIATRATPETEREWFHFFPIKKGIGPIASDMVQRFTVPVMDLDGPNRNAGACRGLITVLFMELLNGLLYSFSFSEAIPLTDMLQLSGRHGIQPGLQFIDAGLQGAFPTGLLPWALLSFMQSMRLL